MFELDEQSASLNPARAHALMNVLQSVSEEEVIFGSRAAGLARAYVYTYEDTPENYAVDVFFHFQQSGRGFRFKYERGHVQRFRLKFLEEQALDFVESLGFMMDNLQIQNMPTHQKNELLKTLPFLENEKYVEKQEASLDISNLGLQIGEQHDIKHKISKLLSSF